MPLIDRSYFEVELNIPKTDDADVQELLDALIQKRETELLKDVLGYPLYKAFMSGLAADPVDPKWSLLLLGGEYMNGYNQLRYWRGLVSAAPALINAVDEATNVSYVAVPADVTSQTIPVPANFVGRTWTLQKRAIGQLRTDEYDVSDDGTSVAFSSPVVLDDTYFFYCNDLSLQQSTGDIKQSLIANYVYYWWLRMGASRTSDTGEVVSNNENSTIQGPVVKMQRAWNEMSVQLKELIDFLYDNRLVYTDWKIQDGYRVLENYKAICRY